MMEKEREKEREIKHRQRDNSSERVETMSKTGIHAQFFESSL